MRASTSAQRCSARRCYFASLRQALRGRCDRRQSAHARCPVWRRDPPHNPDMGRSRAVHNVGRDVACFLSSGAPRWRIFRIGRRRFAAFGTGQFTWVLSAYMLANLEVEAWHCLFPQRAILEVRIFRYADIEISFESRRFLADLTISLLATRLFLPRRDPILRDYAGALELGAGGRAQCVRRFLPLSAVREMNSSSLLPRASAFKSILRGPPAAHAIQGDVCSEFRKAVSLGYGPGTTMKSAAAGRA